MQELLLSHHAVCWWSGGHVGSDHDNCLILLNQDHVFVNFKRWYTVNMTPDYAFIFILRIWTKSRSESASGSGSASICRSGLNCYQSCIECCVPEDWCLSLPERSRMLTNAPCGIVCVSCFLSIFLFAFCHWKLSVFLWQDRRLHAP